jgi:hypothetical protein
MPVPSKPTIHLAEWRWDQRQAREARETELPLDGYSRSPDLQLPIKTFRDAT